jgi:hypothetical protein
MVGVSRILRGGTVTNLLGDEKISPEQEKDLRKKYILRALEILQMKIEGQELFTLDGTI